MGKHWRICSLLGKELTIEVNDLQKELIFNFSISKIVENLTILDPDKVLSFVQKAIKELSKLLNFDFSNNQLFCCTFTVVV